MAGSRSGDEVAAQLTRVGEVKLRRLLVIITFSSEGRFTEVIPMTSNRQSPAVPRAEG